MSEPQVEQLDLLEEAIDWDSWFRSLPVDPEPERVARRPKLTAPQRRYLKREVDRRQRERLSKRPVRLDLGGSS